MSEPAIPAVFGYLLVLAAFTGVGFCVGFFRGVNSGISMALEGLVRKKPGWVRQFEIREVEVEAAEKVKKLQKGVSQ